MKSIVICADLRESFKKVKVYYRRGSGQLFQLDLLLVVYIFSLKHE